MKKADLIKFAKEVAQTALVNTDRETVSMACEHIGKEAKQEADYIVDDGDCYVVIGPKKFEIIIQLKEVK